MTGIKVIGAGLGRTGTLSLSKALSLLGFGPCYHMYELRGDSTKIDDWLEVQEGRANWQKIYQGYQATTDFPGCLYYKELLDAYPDAKVVLTVRDPERWYQSVYNTIYKISHLAPKWFLLLSPKAAKLNRLVSRGVDKELFDDRFEDKEHAISVFNQHIENVKAAIPAEQLLIYQVKQGWKPLCDFLEVPVPVDQTFPNVNDTEQMKQMLSRMRLVFRTAEVSALAICCLVAIKLLV